MAAALAARDEAIADAANQRARAARRGAALLGRVSAGPPAQVMLDEQLRELRAAGKGAYAQDPFAFETLSASDLGDDASADGVLLDLADLRAASSFETGAD